VWQLAVGFATLYVVWGTTYLAIKIGVGDEHLPPYLFGGSRIGAAGLVLLACHGLRGQSFRIPRSEWRGLLLGAIFLFVGGNGFISAGLQYVSSGETAVLAATMTLWIALFSCFIPGGDRLRPIGWLGLFLGLCGVVVLEWPLLRTQGFSLASIGPWLVLASAGAWGIGSVVLRQNPSRMPRLAASGWQMALGGGFMILVGLALGERPPDKIEPATIAVFVYLLVFGSLIAFVTFQWMLEHVAATKVGTYAYANPVVAVFLGSWWRGEPLTAELLGGLALILVAVFLVRGGAPANELAPEQDDATGQDG
jgi:drug/metabolite transporter (DMT)-like permease